MLNTFTGGNDSGVAFLSHRLVLLLGEFEPFRRTISVSSMLQQLSWPSLQIRQKISRLQLFHKIFHYQTSLSIPIYYLPVTRDNIRHYHPNQFILPPVSTTSHLQSFFSKTIKEWNNLPKSILDITDYETFSNKIHEHLIDSNTS